MLYLLILNQDGGCDYTIGCGISYEIFEAETREKAAERALLIVNTYCGLEELEDLWECPSDIVTIINNPDSRTINTVELYQISDLVNVPLDSHFESIEKIAKKKSSRENVRSTKD